MMRSDFRFLSGFWLANRFELLIGSHNRYFSLVGPLVWLWIAITAFLGDDLYVWSPVFVPKCNPKVTEKGFTPHNLKAMGSCQDLTVLNILNCSPH